MVSTKRIGNTACPHDASVAHGVDIKYSFDKPSEITEIRIENHRSIMTGVLGVIDGLLPASRADLLEFTDRASFEVIDDNNIAIVLPTASKERQKQKKADMKARGEDTSVKQTGKAKFYEKHFEACAVTGVVWVRTSWSLLDFLMMLVKATRTLNLT